MNNLVKESINQARSYYKKLPTPKIMSEDLYIRNWIHSAIARNTAEAVSKNVNQSDYQSSVDFFITYPHELQNKLQTEIWKVSPEKRNDVWNKLKVPYENIEKSFIGLIIQRNKLALSKDYKTFIDYNLALYKIPKSIYKSFIKNFDEIIKTCNSHLPTNDINHNFYTEFGNHCYLCNLKNFPLKSFNEIKHYMSSNNRIINLYKSKIDISFGDSSQSRYIKEIDRFDIQIDKNQNFKHQSIDLIHELSHIIYRIECYKNEILPEEKGSYFNELETTKIELNFIKNISMTLYNTIFGEFLKVFHRVLFEIEIYEKPNQNLDNVYSLTFNKCFKYANQISNRSFILDELIIRNPFSTLPHAIAQYRIINQLI